ncbi:class I SAM-dependent methyltransferase [Kribbella italica]|uniref:2-polyprenyl-3-methyl-5-hydroxy-6-metoxy-1, 4-benzoquinol methylase n=1 Tax=Kribbella italica TaxID=1540520 RepID=A0A7W9J697_9ACTN|nr:class I SAM-dependent methyltransferase [Kribbella italica]MBB5836396.1 2-polyprenyl-3-methyl-5-hydroxy-6-metoxy-1,4-benzoquinol methylase [Kribbella italica]
MTAGALVDHADGMDKEYLFDTSSDLGLDHMDYLATVLDGPTTRFLDALGVQPGQRCLDLGAGGGSITRWLADRTGPTGQVVAVDIATDHLVEGPGVEVYQHDITTGLPVEGPFDLIHARLVLLHLPQREQVFDLLVNALAPGGWLVLGDCSERPLSVVAAPTPEDRAVWERMMHVSHDLLGAARGIDLSWAHTVQGRMEEAGLLNVHGIEYSETARGGSAGSLLHLNLNQQAEPLLLELGATPADMARYRELLLDPGFRAWFYQFVCNAGQRSR